MVSEETGQISVAYGGQLKQDLGADGLRALLVKKLTPAPGHGNWLVEHVRRFLGSLIPTRTAAVDAVPAETESGGDATEPPDAREGNG